MENTMADELTLRNFDDNYSDKGGINLLMSYIQEGKPLEQISSSFGLGTQRMNQIITSLLGMTYASWKAKYLNIIPDSNVQKGRAPFTDKQEHTETAFREIKSMRLNEHTLLVLSKTNRGYFINKRVQTNQSFFTKGIHFSAEDFMKVKNLLSKPLVKNAKFEIKKTPTDSIVVRLLPDGQVDIRTHVDNNNYSGYTKSGIRGQVNKIKEIFEYKQDREY